MYAQHISMTEHLQCNIAAEHLHSEVFHRDFFAMQHLDHPIGNSAYTIDFETIQLSDPTALRP